MTTLEILSTGSHAPAHTGLNSSLGTSTAIAGRDHTVRRKLGPLLCLRVSPKVIITDMMNYFYVWFRLCVRWRKRRGRRRTAIFSQFLLMFIIIIIVMVIVIIIDDVCEPVAAAIIIMELLVITRLSTTTTTWNGYWYD